MLEMGIVDPAKVTRAAVENAVSVAGMILTTEAIIVKKMSQHLLCLQDLLGVIWAEWASNKKVNIKKRRVKNFNSLFFSTLRLIESHIIYSYHQAI